MLRILVTFTFALALTSASLSAQQSLQADIIVTGARVWTGDTLRPYAEAIATRGARILAVGTRAQVEALAGSATERINANGGFVAPGFIDNHTHFERAGELLLGVNLLAVASDTAFVRALRAARDRMPRGAWVIGGEWGAYEEWAQNATGGDAAATARRSRWSPRRALLDSITPNTPVLINRWDRTEYFANRVALERAGASCSWDGVECSNGQMTGKLNAQAATRVRRAMPAKSLEQRLAEARAALNDLASHGVTTIHDNTGAAQMRVYQELKRRGELSVRVYARPTLDRWDELAAAGIRHGFGDEWIRIGGLKGFVDGIMGNSTARFYEPQLHSGERGSWRTMMTDSPGMLPLLIGADSTGHWPQVHAIGDEAIDTLLDMFEHVMRVNGPRDRRFRLIHTQVMRNADVARRMAKLGIIAEVQPFHAIDDMRWMEQRIGARSRWAYAFKTLQDAGVKLSFGSDWPGTNAAWYPAEPILGIYAAVTRQTLDGKPASGWYPEERVDVETAMRAYTINNAWAADEDAIKGSLAPGKLADFVVLDRNPFDVAPAAIKDIRVLRTVVGGRTVFSGTPPATSRNVVEPKHFVFFDVERHRITEPAFLTNPNIAGAQLKYTWRELEPERDQYQLNLILNDLAVLRKHGKQLFIQLQDASFSERILVPDYLVKDPAFGGGADRSYSFPGDDESKPKFDGWVARRWDPAVRARFIKLLDVLGKELDGRIEGLALAETSVGFGRTGKYHPAGYSYENYLEGVKAIMSAARNAFQRSAIIQYANFMPGEWLPGDDNGYLRGVYAHADSMSVGVGGPDVLPHRRGQQNHSYPLIAARGPNVVAGVAVQDGNLEAQNPETEQAVTVRELYDFAKKRLRADYIFWGTQEPYYSRDVIRFLRDLGKR